MSAEPVEREQDIIPADLEPGYTQHRVEGDIEFLAFAMGEKFEAFIDLCIWRAKHRRQRYGQEA